MLILVAGNITKLGTSWNVSSILNSTHIKCCALSLQQEPAIFVFQVTLGFQKPSHSHPAAGFKTAAECQLWKHWYLVFKSANFVNSMPISQSCFSVVCLHRSPTFAWTGQSCFNGMSLLKEWARVSTCAASYWFSFFEKRFRAATHFFSNPFWRTQNSQCSHGAQDMYMPPLTCSVWPVISAWKKT